MAQNSYKMQYEYVENDAEKEDNWKINKLLEIIEKDLKGFDDSIHQKSLIFTNSDRASSIIACNLYAKLKTKPLLFALKQYELPTPEDHLKNEELIDRFRKNSQVIGLTHFDVQEKTNFPFAKHFVFFDFPLDWKTFLDVMGKIENGSKKCGMAGKITVIGSEMTAVQKIAFASALQNAGESLPKSLENFVIDNATASLKKMKNLNDLKDEKSYTRGFATTLQSMQKQPDVHLTPVRKTAIKHNSIAVSNKDIRLARFEKYKLWK